MKALSHLIPGTLALGSVLALVSAGHGAPPPPGAPAVDCSGCHTCGVPTSREPCLKSCPRPEMVRQTAKHELREAPVSMLLDELVSIYQPVQFDHRGHAGMAEMGLDCATCHHFSPAGTIPPCSDCHEASGGTSDLTKPNLKGAYHRQCLACHREWSHDTKCVVCHAPAESEKITDALPDPTDIVGTEHPKITVPTTEVYSTPYQQGPVVTFQHQEHVDLFGFVCVDCHRKESCVNCHDVLEGQRPTRTQEQLHAMCNDCHASDPCAKCHDTHERPGFTHKKTGWPLTNYHERLDCWSCHPKGKRMGRLNKMCRNCHATWTPENFQHAVTGLRLDETHAGVDCDACHEDHRYNETPTCATCHDDGRTADSAPPGQKARHTR